MRDPGALTFSSPDPEAHGDLGIVNTLLGGVILGVTTLGFIAVDAHIEIVAALQVFSAVGDEEVDSIVEMTDNSEAEVLTHACSSRTKRHHRIKELGRIVPNHAC